MSDNQIIIPGQFWKAEVNDTKVKSSVTSITIAGGTATVVATAHGLAVGDYFTVSGATGTGVTGLNGTMYQVTGVTDANTFTFATALTGTVGGTVILEPCTLLSSGTYHINTGANATVEFNPDSTGYLNDSTASTWRLRQTVSVNGGYHQTDGLSLRVRHPSAGSAGSTFISRVN